LISSLVERRGDVRWAGPARVVTSARWQTAVEGGFASYLAGLREQCRAEVATPRLATSPAIPTSRVAGAGTGVDFDWPPRSAAAIPT
jgi:hypothetical protein